MSPERHYNDQEVAAIFKQAAEAQEAARQRLPHSEGLTLAELQQIGQAAGITPEFIAQAAASVDRISIPRPRTTFFGLPIGVERTVELPRPLSDEAWDHLVVDLRETFQAHGTLQRDGSLRQWTNGNLQALLEPTEHGQRLRLRTLKGDAKPGLGGSLAAFAFGLTMLLIAAGTGKLDLAIMVSTMLLSALGLGLFGYTTYQLPRWAAERERQMEAIATRATALAEASDPPGLQEEELTPRLNLDALSTPADTKQASAPRKTRT